MYFREQVRRSLLHTSRLVCMIPNPTLVTVTSTSIKTQQPFVSISTMERMPGITDSDTASGGPSSLNKKVTARKFPGRVKQFSVRDM